MKREGKSYNGYQKKSAKKIFILYSQRKKLTYVQKITQKK